MPGEGWPHDMGSYANPLLAAESSTDSEKRPFICQLFLLNLFYDILKMSSK
jgi:hypothetical protein